MFRPSLALVFVVSVAVVTACGSDSDTTTVTPPSKTVTFKATMNSAAEVQTNPVTSAATGTFTGVLDTSTNVFNYTITYSGLTSGLTLGHIHGPAATTVSTGAVLNFANVAGGTFTLGTTSGTVSGTTTLNAANQITATINGDSLRKLMFAGLTYANLHTTNFGQGEIRGQLVKQ